MSALSQLLLCTHNPGKRDEMVALLSDLGASIEVLTAPDIADLPDPDEDGDSFLDNARIKSRSAFAHTGIPSLADDSGLCVPALSGAPGIYSARYAGVEGPGRDAANRQELREAIAELPEEERVAYFQCTMVLQLDAEREVVFEGQCHGTLLLEERGEHGFGYDSMFFMPSLDKTFAEIERSQKNQISHRGLALQKLREWLQTQAS